MSDKGSFHDYYLRRIGVATPTPVAGALSSCAPAIVSADVSVHEPDTSGGYSLSSSTSVEGLNQLQQAASQCTDCELSESRTHVVFGVGSEHPDVLFIGEAPGEQEDEIGEPFVGKTGELLDQMLLALNWSRSNVYIMNVVKCRPPENRNPKVEEVKACSRWLDAQWDVLQPKLVCLLGKVAAQHVLGSDASLASLRGRWHEYRGVPVRVSYHPAYLLRSPTQKARAWQDFRALFGRSRAV
ncbi:MAG: uracil-DNA glycosylase [Mariprofundaceae bacterium]